MGLSMRRKQQIALEVAEKYRTPEETTVTQVSESRARQISAYYQAPTNGFAVFASTGTIPFGFLDEIQREYLLYPYDAEERKELEELFTYITSRYADGTDPEEES